MMKRFLTILLLAGASTTFAGVAEDFGKTAEPHLTQQDKGTGISFFHGEWEQALAKSKQDKKLIFLDAYAAWCGPCKWMAKNAFMDEEVGKLFNANFINVKMDMEKNKEGSRLMQKYSIRAYPTLVFVDHNEEAIHVSVGALKPKELLALGQQVVSMP
jgi:thiol:disulfide interchange protein